MRVIEGVTTTAGPGRPGPLGAGRRGRRTARWCPILAGLLVLLAIRPAVAQMVDEPQGPPEAPPAAPGAAGDATPATDMDEDQVLEAEAAEDAEDAEPAGPDEPVSAATTDRPWTMPVSELEWRLRPMQLEGIEAEAGRWIDLLQESIIELSRIKIIGLRGIEDPQEQALLADRESALLQQGRAIVERLNVVLKSLARKGGDASGFERYRDAVIRDLLDARDAAVAEDVLDKQAQEEQEQPVETMNPWDVPVRELQWRLRPMRGGQLETELDRWLGLLEDKVRQLSEVKIAGLGEIENADTEAALVERETRLLEHRAAIVERLDAVILALKLRGGDVEAAESYRDAVTGDPVFSVSEAFFDPGKAWLQLKNWAMSSEGGLKILRNLGMFLVIMIAFQILARIVGRVVAQGLKRLKKTSQLLQDFLIGFVRRVIMIVGVVVAVQELGVNIGPLIAAIGAAGLVIGLALQGTLSNFASGLLILLFRPYDVGDVISAAGITGKVERMTLFTTIVVTFDNQLMIVPNNEIWNNVITNITGRSTRRVDLVFGIGYRDDVDRARDILDEVVRAHPKVLKTPEPNIRVNELGDSSVNFIVRPWSRTEDYWDVYWDLQREVKRRFDAEGINIPFPQRDLSFSGPVEVVVKSP